MFNGRPRRRKLYQIVVSIIILGPFLLNSTFIDFGWAKEDGLRWIRLCETSKTNPTNKRRKKFERAFTKQALTGIFSGLGYDTSRTSSTSSFDNWMELVPAFAAFPDELTRLAERIHRLGIFVKELPGFIEWEIMLIHDVFLKLDAVIKEQSDLRKSFKIGEQEASRKLRELLNKLLVIADMNELNSSPDMLFLIRTLIENPRTLTKSITERAQTMRIPWCRKLRIRNNELLRIVKSAFSEDPKAAEEAIVILAEELMMDLFEEKAFYNFVITTAERDLLMPLFVVEDRGPLPSPFETARAKKMANTIHSESIQALSRLINALDLDIREQLLLRHEIQKFMDFSQRFNSTDGGKTSPVTIDDLRLHPITPFNIKDILRREHQKHLESIKAFRMA